MRIYVETSVVSFCFDRKPHNREKRAAARQLLLCCRDGIHEGCISNVVLAEIGRSLEPFRSQELRFIRSMGLADVTVDRERADHLVAAYREDVALRALPEDDLRHLAIYCLSDAEGLATCNLRHIANQLMLNLVRKVNHAEGIHKEIRVGPPEAFLPPGP